MRVSKLRTILDTRPDDDGEIVIELPGLERGVRPTTWAPSPARHRLLVLVDL